MIRGHGGTPIEVVPLDAAALTTSIEPFEQKPAAGIQILPQTSAIAAVASHAPTV